MSMTPPGTWRAAPYLNARNDRRSHFIGCCPRASTMVAFSPDQVPSMTTPSHPPFKDLLKSIPGFFGIRLEEEPEFDILEQLGDVEIRRYKPALLASVTVDGDHDEAMNTAFKKLAGYIFGDNDRDQQSEMTTPVLQANERTLSPSIPVLRDEANGTWTLTFFLSNSVRSSEAPKPNGPSIRLVDEPASTVASLRYTGNNTEESRKDSKIRLLAELAQHPEWRVADDVTWALYDQPFSIPFLKRNEAHVALTKRQS